ncbi:hypothetical protein [Pasteuria penetrans]|uniref:hypothetical protein n=1 Tax=Pasteuria penetrans TaxID=86005 RepID=UPI0011EDFAF9|nr:hypothetical protein [Pasteuria penetrans]
MQRRHSGTPTMGKPGAITQWAGPTQTTAMSWGGRRVGAQKPPGLGQGAGGKEQKHKGIKTKDQGTKGKKQGPKTGKRRA